MTEETVEAPVEELEIEEPETPEESPEEVDEPEDAPEDEPSKEPEEAELEEYETEEDYVEKELGLGRKTMAEVASENKQMQEQLDAIKEHQATTGLEPIKPQPEIKQDEHKFFANRGLAAQHIGKIQFNTDEAGQKGKATYGALAQVIDSTLDPTLDQLETVLQDFRGSMAFMIEHTRKASYESLPNKNLVPFKDLKGIMDQRGLLDAGTALREYLVYNKPELLSQLTKKAFKKGETKGQERKFKKFSASRRAKQPSSKGNVWANYTVKGDDTLIDKNKLDRIPSSKKQKEIVDAHFEHFYKE